MIKRLGFIRLAIFATLLFLGACAGTAKDEDTGVQDIQPGERSVIQPPSSQPVQPDRQIEERAI